MAAISAEDHSNNITALGTTGEDAPISHASTDYIETITASVLLNELINTKRSVLNESNNSLEIVLGALKTQNTDHIGNSTVPGVYVVLTNTDPTVFTRINSSIEMNYIESNSTILASILGIEKQRQQKCERNRLNQIKKGSKTNK